MDTATYKTVALSQFEASLSMLEECIRVCPAIKWKSRVGKYAFWHVAYHTLYCTDGYAARCADAFRPHPRFMPGGITDMTDEYPSREMTRKELVAYTALVRRRVRQAIRRETTATLSGPAGFPWLAFTRAELHLYSMRHVQHHAGQLAALLRRARVATAWAREGTSPSRPRKG